MKILLVVPPGKDISKYKSTSFLNFTAAPLGLAYLAAVLEENGYNKVSILDCHAQGISIDQFKVILSKKKPDIVGFQVLTPTFVDALIAAKVAKSFGSLVIFGGYHPTAMPDESLELSDADIVFRGEAEHSLLEFIQKYEKNENWKEIHGISYKENGKIIHNDAAKPVDVDSLPLPARHLLPMKEYRLFGSSFPATTLITSRGCPYACDFCSVSSFYNAKWRPRSPEKIADEIEFIREDLELRAAAFVDDLFFVSNKRVEQLCYHLNKVDDLFWGATTRADKGDFEHLELMRKAGCRLVFVGVESGNQDILDNINKKTNVSQIENYFKNIRKARMDSLASVSFGFPGETRESIIQTTNWVINTLDPELALFTIATPFPGTSFYDQAKKDGLIKEHDYSKYNLFHPIMETSGLSRDYLKELTKWSFKKFYLRPSIILNNTKREFKYSLESYGLKQFLQNSQVFAKGILNMRLLSSL